MVVCFVTYKHGENDATSYPHLFTRIAIHGDVFDGLARPGDGTPDRRYFISVSRIQAIEFWDVVDTAG